MKREHVTWLLVGAGMWLLWTELGVVKFWLLCGLGVAAMLTMAPLDADELDRRVVPPLDGCTCDYPARRPCDHRAGCVHAGHGDEWQDG